MQEPPVDPALDAPVASSASSASSAPVASASSAMPGAGASSAGPSAGRARPPRRPATIDEVAALAGCSIATVSRVFTNRKPVRDDTRRRVLDAAAALEYRPSGPAQALAGSPTGMLGLLMTDLTQSFYTELAHAVEAEAAARGYTLILANGGGDEAREAAYLDLLAQRRVDGILVASRGVTNRHMDWLVDAPVEVVLLTCEAPGVPLPATVADSRGGAALAAAHLLGLGHRRLGEILGPASNASTLERHAGVLDALAAVSMPASALAVVTGTGDVTGGFAAASALLAGPTPPTAILCYNDLTAVGALRAAEAAGLRVPADLSIVGFDDVPIASLVSPALTTVAQAIPEMAHWAVERIASQIAARRSSSSDAPAVAPVVRTACRLVVRGSTGPAPR